jgi:hypothetical protein
MGAWGDGIFDSDQSLDFAWTVIENLIREIQSGLYLLVARRDDYYDSEYKVVPAIRLVHLILLETKIKPPDSQVVKEWKQTYIDNLNPSRIAGGDEPLLQTINVIRTLRKPLMIWFNSLKIGKNAIKKKLLKTKNRRKNKWQSTTKN